MKTSTNALTKRYCELQGWPCATVQSFYGGRRHDLFGIADSIVLLDDSILFVQNCSYGTIKSHRTEIDKSKILPLLDAIGVKVDLWEWRKKRVGRKDFWFMRGQTRIDGGWSDVGFWTKPLDLYPKKAK